MGGILQIFTDSWDKIAREKKNEGFAMSGRYSYSVSKENAAVCTPVTHSHWHIFCHVLLESGEGVVDHGKFTWDNTWSQKVKQLEEAKNAKTFYTFLIHVT